MNNSFKIFYLSLIIISIILLDQVTKFYIQNSIVYGSYPFICIRSIWNKGISFSMFASNCIIQRYFLITLTIVLIIFLIKCVIDAKHFSQIGFCMMIGGAIGNLIDRIYHGAVFDFIQIHFCNFYFPTCNIADIFISIGITIIFLENLLCQKK